MSKLIRSLFGKNKDKKSETKPKRKSTRLSEDSSNDIQTTVIARDGQPKINIDKIKARNKTYRRTSGSLANDSAYLNKLFGLNKDASVVRQAPLNAQREPNGKVKPYSNTDPIVYTASVHQNPQFSPQKLSQDYPQYTNYRESCEPFPYKVYDPPPPRRSTLIYGVDYDSSLLQSKTPRYSADKCSDFGDPSAYIKNKVSNLSNLNYQDYQDKSGYQNRRVTITIPSENDDISSTEPTRKTVLRARPHSSVSLKPRESMKMMAFRADQIEHPPMIPGKNVHQFPLQRVKHAPVLMTDDGKLLKPVENDKVRTSLALEEAKLVRLSKAEIENVCRASRKSKDELRQSIRRSMSRRNSESVNRYSIQREGSVFQEENTFPFSVEENKPMVYAVPVLPSRNRSKSFIQNSIVEPKEHLKYIDPKKKLRFSTSSSQAYNPRFSVNSFIPDTLNINQYESKPITVYEVHNLAERRYSSSKSENEKITEKHKPEARSVKPKQRTRRSTIESTNNMGEQQQPIRNSAELSSETLLFPKKEKRKSRNLFRRKRKMSSSSKKSIESEIKDFCGLMCESNDKITPSFCPVDNYENKPKMVSSFQQTDVEDDLDFLCYPAESLSKSSTGIPEADKKMRWRIIIKREQEN